MTSPRHGLFAASRRCRRPGEDGWTLERLTVRVYHDGRCWWATFGPATHLTWSQARIQGWSFEAVALDVPTPEQWGRARVTHGALR